MDHDHNAVPRPRRLSPKAAVLFPIVAAIFTGGCEMPAMPELPSLPAIPGVYRIDIQQGNVVDQVMVGQLEFGMERRKVLFIMGTPLLVDPFNQDRWDYFYSLRPGSGEEVSQRVTLHFDGDRLARIDNRLRSDLVTDTPAERTQTLVKVPKRQSPQGILERLTPDFLEGDDGVQGDEAADGEQTVTE